MVPGAFLSIVCENGVKISKNKKYNFLHFIEILEIIQRGGPWDQKFSKLSKVHQTCRTGREHKKNKHGSGLEVFSPKCGALGDQEKSEIGSLQQKNGQHS